MRSESWRWKRTDCTVVYAPGGRTTHLLSPLESANVPGIAPALCGYAPTWPTPWLGTGSQDEIERAMLTPPCGRCLAMTMDG